MRRLAATLSLSRAVVFGPITALLEVHHWWLAAFISLALGALTDALDGWAARRFGSETTAGKDWVDPLCDAALGMWVMLGLALGSSQAQQILQAGTLMVALGIPMKALKHRRRHDALYRLANIGLPLCEWTTFYVLGWLILYQEYGTKMTVTWLSVSIPAVLIIGYLKRQRLLDWWEGRR